MSRDIDVIVPVYNKCRELPVCLESILSQKRVEPHIICVDDGSTDGSGALLDEAALKNPAVTVYHVVNGGVSAARNVGLQHAESEWFTFCDADDVLLPDALDHLLSVAEGTGCDLAAGCTEKETASGSDVYDGGAPAVYADGKDILRLGLKSQFEGCFAKIYKTQSLGSVRFDEDLRINEDGLYVLRALTKCGKVAVTDIPVYRYCFNPSSASHDVFSEKYRDILTAGERKKQYVAQAADAALAESFSARHELLYLNKMASCSSGYSEEMLAEARQNVLGSAHALIFENGKERLRVLLIRCAFGIYLKIMRRHEQKNSDETDGPDGLQAGSYGKRNQ